MGRGKQVQTEEWGSERNVIVNWQQNEKLLKQIWTEGVPIPPIWDELADAVLLV